jgi:hypothetical protein
MKSSEKCYIVRHVMPQAADISGCYPGSEVYAMGYGNHKAAMADFWEQVMFAIRMSKGEIRYTVQVQPNGDVWATRVGDERDVIIMEPTKYGIEGRGVGTGYWAKQETEVRG